MNISGLGYCSPIGVSLYPRLIHQWLSISGIFARFAGLTVNIWRIKPAASAMKETKPNKKNYHLFPYIFLSSSNLQTIIYSFVTRLTWQVPHVEQELLTLPKHPSATPVFSGVHVAWSLVFCVMFCRLLFVLWFFFFLAIVLSVLRFMASDYPFGIFKFFSYHQPWQPSWIIDGIYGHNFETNHPRRIWTKIGFIPSSGSGEDFQRKSHGSHFGCKKRSLGKIYYFQVWSNLAQLVLEKKIKIWKANGWQTPDANWWEKEYIIHLWPL